MPQVRRYSYRFPRRGTGFRGEHSREGVTDEIYQAGYLSRARNYHFVGRGRALKRQGHQAYGAAMAAGEPIQALQMFEWGTTRKLYGVADGDLYRYDESAGAWGGVTGGITLPSGKDEQVRFTHFRDGSGENLVGIANGRPWRVSAAGNAEYCTANSGIGPTNGLDVEEFMGRLWVIEKNGALHRCDDGISSTWGEMDGGTIYCTRESPGVGLERHGQQALLVFHQRSIHSILFNYSGQGQPWIVRTADARIGCDYASSIVHYKGVTYFKGPDGFYRLKSPTKPAEYIGYPMEEVWQDLLYSRLPYMRAFSRGEPWNEIVWCATKADSTQHNIFFVFNTELETWFVFDSASGDMDFNCGASFTNSNGKQITLLGGYNGQVNAAWGDDEYETGYRDNGDSGGLVASELRTGMMDFGYPGIKRLREIWAEAEVQFEKSFNLEIIGLSEDPIVSKEVALETRQGSRLSIDFILGQSRLSGSDVPTQAKFRVSARSRAFQSKLTEQNDTKPHKMHALTYWFLPRANRFDP